MKLNWSTRIALLYIAFVLMIGTLVAATFRQRPALVADDYYYRETCFQEHLNASNAAAALGAPPALRVLGDSIELRLPGIGKGQEATGTLTFYAPADPGSDQRIAFRAPDGAVRAALPSRRTRYELQLDWNAAGVHYYAEIPGTWIR